MNTGFLRATVSVVIDNNNNINNNNNNNLRASGHY